ncbi:MAG: hypothetical protein IJ390_13000 [Lachnospiraceae bacterium]|nr:hypothetical protein [Lachnospiraceae bacterium]
MKFRKKKKGTKGYLNSQRKVMLLWTVLLFVMSLGIFLIGYINTGSKENYLTIIAVLGCLPASRSLVNTIVLFRYHGISDADYKKIQPHVKDRMTCCDMVFTSYEKNYEIHHLAFQKDTLVGYTANPSCDAKACEKHLHELFAKNDLGEVDIKIFKDLPKYLNRLDSIALKEEELSENEEASQKAQSVRALLCALSL